MTLDEIEQVIRENFSKPADAEERRPGMAADGRSSGAQGALRRTGLTSAVLPAPVCLSDSRLLLTDSPL